MYTTPEGYKYTTDSKGRICSAEGVLQDGVAKRNEYAQQNVGKGDGRRGVSDSNLNRGAWKSMENEWAKALSNDKTGKLEIKVKIKPIYEDLTQRPTEFVVKYKKMQEKYIAK